MEIKVVKGIGPKRPKLIAIGEAPGEEEVNQGLPFVGPSGHIQDGILSSAGLLRSDCFLDNVVPIRPPMNKLERLSELGVTVEMFIPNLSQTLTSIDCPVIIAYGDVAMYYLTGVGEVSKKGEISGISKHRGSIYPCILDPRKLVVPTFHPRFVIENWKMRGVVVEDLKKAIRVGKGGRKDVTFNTKIKPTMQEVEFYFDLFKEASKLSLDIELVGSGQIACVGLGADLPALNGRVSLCVPFKFGYQNYWSEKEEFYIWELLRQLLGGDQLKIGQNLNYDFTRLLPFIGEPAPPWYDCMVAFHLLEPELPHTLAFMTSMFTDVNYYKDDPKDEEGSWKYTTSSERLWVYNCLMKGNRVLTDQGSIPIEFIVNHKLGIQALSFNEVTGKFEFKKIDGWYKKVVENQSWIRIVTKIDKRGLVVTPEHRIRLKSGWIEAKDVKAGDWILIEEQRFSKDELGFIIGMLLGDASFGSKKSDELAYIQCTQTVEELVNLKKKLLDRISLDTTPFEATNSFKPGKRFSFISRSLYQLEELRKQLIFDGIKRPYLLDYLTPKGLAIWFMDDGCLIKERNGRQPKCSLAIHGFTVEDRQIVKDWFIDRYNEPATLTKVGALIMSVGMSKKFCNEISSYIIPELQYKLPYRLSDYIEFTLNQTNVPASTKILKVEDYKFSGKKPNQFNKIRYCITVEDNHNFFTPFGLVANCKDVEIPLILEPILTKELKDFGMLSRFYGFDMPKMRVMWRVQQRGILVDDEKRVELLVKEVAEVESLKTQLKGVVGYDLNPLSPKQMMKFLYEDLKLPPQRHRKTKKLTANEEAIEKLFGRYPRPEFALALEIRDKMKDIGTYLATKDKETGEYTLPKTDPDGRMRSRYNICGTATGRTSSKKTYDDTGIDAQNIPENLREMFIAPEGKVLQVFDLWQAETYVVAVLSGCKSFLDKLRHGEKIHKLVAGWVFGKPEDQIDNVNRPGGEYFLGKRTNHACAYGLGWGLFMIIANTDIGKYNKDHPNNPKPFISAAQAKAILLTYETNAPEIKMWHQEVVSELQRTRMLVTPFGRKRLFRSYRGQKDSDTPRKGFAHVPQSTIAEYAHQAIIKLEYLLPPGNVIIQEGFDAFIIEAREEDVEENERLVRFACDKELMWKGERFKIPVEEAGRGRRWKK